MEKPRIGCVVMAAGNASRFGANKLAAQVDGKTLLRRALEAVPPACFAPENWGGETPEELAVWVGEAPPAPTEQGQLLFLEP